jgi:mRNA-decapping enzyme 1B
VYSRVAEPFNSIFINNRLNTNSLVEPITRQIQLQEQSPFLLYRNERSAISGFWFYCKEDCVRIHGLLEKLIKKCNNPKSADSNDSGDQSVQQQIFARNQNLNGGNGNVDIFSMLSKAQEDFNNSGVGEKPAPSQLNQQFAAMQLNPQPPHVSHQPLMKQISTMPDITSSNVVNFFAAAQQPNGKPDGAHFIHPKVPPVQTLDEIEKQHRVSASPPQANIGKNSNKMSRFNP